MNEALNPAQLTTLCLVFVAFHLLALPAFIWAMRHRQFRGAEQRVWSLEDGEALPADPRIVPPSPRRARWMLGILMTFAALTLSAIVLTLVVAVGAPAHPVAASGAKCPF